MTIIRGKSGSSLIWFYFLDVCYDSFAIPKNDIITDTHLHVFSFNSYKTTQSNLNTNKNKTLKCWYTAQRWLFHFSLSLHIDINDLGIDNTVFANRFMDISIG